MQDALQAYSETAKTTLSPRDLEANLLLKAASHLQTIKDNWGSEENDLQAALYYNRQLWTIFLGSISDAENPLPIDIKNNVASLGVFVLNHTIDIQADPKPEKLGSLININRELAAGLHDGAEK